MIARGKSGSHDSFKLCAVGAKSSGGRSLTAYAGVPWYGCRTMSLSRLFRVSENTGSALCLCRQLFALRGEKVETCSFIVSPSAKVVNFLAFARRGYAGTTTRLGSI